MQAHVWQTSPALSGTPLKGGLCFVPFGTSFYVLLANNNNPIIPALIMPKIEPFEMFTNDYDDWFIKNKKIYELEIEAVKQLIPANSYGLEIGVGSGKFAAPLGIKIGVEPSKAMAKKARKCGIKVFEGVAENLPFENETFDFVLFVTTICFVDDLKKSFEEAHRILKKEGSIIVGFVDKNSEIGKKNIAGKSKSKFYKIATFYSTDEVLKHLTNAGFCDFVCKQTIFPKPKNQLISDGFGKGSFVVVKGLKTQT